MPEIDLAHLDIVAFADPAGSKTEVKKVQARSAIAVVAGDAYERVFVLEAWARRTTTDKFVDTMYELYDKWRPRIFGIEANAMQSIFADMLRREARLRAVRIPFIDVRQPTRIEKPFRNRSQLQPIINAGRFLMAKDEQIEARNELETHPMCAQFDLVDSIATASTLLRRSAPVDAQQDSRAAFVKYLRATGAPPWYIEQVAAGRVDPTNGATPPRRGS